MFMRWVDLLFMHWPVDPANLRPHVPPGLGLETFDGRAWLGVVPFVMTRTRPRGLPPMPGLSTFPELNVRTYVSHGAGERRRPGIWFFSLDAASRLAVRGARATFHLPYFDARMSVDRGADGWLTYRSTRTHKNAPPAAFDARYRPTGPAVNAARGSFDYWLTERYCLYAADARGRLYRGDIHHGPWPLQPAEADVRTNTMAGQLRLRLPDVPPVLHFAQTQDVRAWWRVRVTE
jgi:uncharacterized protein YqjF (DUF2071 family)